MIQPTGATSNILGLTMQPVDIVDFALACVAAIVELRRIHCQVPNWYHTKVYNTHVSVMFFAEITVWLGLGKIARSVTYLT